MKKFLAALLKKLTYAFAIVIIIFAILMTLMRALTPLLDRYHNQFELWASNILHTPVKIQRIMFDWYQYQPAITLKQTTILNPDTKEPILQVQKIRVLFSIPSSIWHWQPILSLIQISGTDITIHQNKEGELSVQGFPNLKGFADTPYAQETKFTTLLSWLAMPEHLVLHDIDARYYGIKGKMRFITLYDFNLENSGAEHHIYGKAVLHQDLPTNITVALDWQGEKVDLNALNAQAYLYVSGLSLGEWLKDLDWQGWQIQSGLASAKIWGTWNKGQLVKLQTKLQAYDLDFYQIKNKLHFVIPRFSGNLGWLHEQDKYVIAGDDLLVDLPDRLWPVNNFYLTYNLDESGTISPRTLTMGYVDLAELPKFLPYFGEYVPAKLADAIVKLNSHGYLQNFNLTLPNAGDEFLKAKVKTNFTYISTDAWQNIPALKNLSGSIDWDGEVGKINLQTKRSEIIDADVFTAPLPLGQVTGDINVNYFKTQELVLATNNLTIDNDDLDATLSGSLKLTSEWQGVADLNAKFSLANVSHISKYVSLKTFDKDLQDWLKKAFIAGELKNGSLTLRGPLTAFPFDKKEGEFIAEADVKNVSLYYAPGWPTIDKINGHVRFQNRQMQINITDSDTHKIQLKNITATIPELRDTTPTILQISADPVKFEFADGLSFIRQSPLNQIIGKVFSNLKLEGPGTLNLKLTIPLKNPEQTQVEGSIEVAEGRAIIMPWNLNIDNLQGLLKFTEKSLTADTMTGRVFAKPINIKIETLNEKIQVFRTNFATYVNIADLQKTLHLPTSNIVSGGADIVGELDVIDNKPLQLNITSDLLGVTVKLPGEFSKPDKISRYLSMDFTIADNSPLLMKLNYGNMIKAALTVAMIKNKYTLQNANIHFGEGDADFAKQAGLFVTGNIPELNWEKIKSYLNQHQDEDNQFSLTMLKNIDVNVAKINLGNQVFTDVDVSLTPSEGLWKLDVQGNEIAGTAQLPMEETSAQPVMINLSRLHLRSSTYTTENNIIDVKSLPPIEFNTDELNYDDKELGRVSFVTQPTRNGLTIRSLRILSPRMTLQAYGDWTQKGKQESTELQGSLSSNHLNDLLRSLHMDIHNFLADTGHLSFDLTWPGAPYAASLTALDGDASIEVGKGRIIDIGQETDSKMDIGRMLSLFSLQTIPRRLSLDFSDIFQKGYSFDSIKGSFHFNSGNARTSDMRIDGPIAKVLINGRIGFSAKDFDLRLKITPYVTSSLPVAAALITAQPLVGVAAWAVNKVISPQVSKAATYDYSVTGSWNNPKWNTLH